VALGGTNFSRGQEPTIVQRLRALGGFLHKTVYGISGYRSPQHSVAVGGFANDPHTRGAAADIGVGSAMRSSAGSVSEATYRRFGLYRPFYPADPNEINHVQLLPGWHGSSGSGGSSGSRGAWHDAILTWYKPSAGGINGRSGGGAWAGHPVYDSTWGCAAPSNFRFGTKITFAYRGRSVTVPVVDRGGAITGNHFDLLPAAAAQLGITGAGRVNAKYRVGGSAAGTTKSSVPATNFNSKGKIAGKGKLVGNKGLFHRPKSDFDAFYTAALTKAQITTPDDKSDDLTVLQAYRLYADQEFRNAVARGDSQGIIEAGGRLTDIDAQISDLKPAAPDPNDDPDLQARLDQATTHGQVVQHDLDLANAFITAAGGPGDIGSGGKNALSAAGGRWTPPPHVTILQSFGMLVPPSDPATLGIIARAAAAGASYQGARPSKRLALGA
jgi:3D (Asp-Asp-Asp) domain-containing protein